MSLHNAFDPNDAGILQPRHCATPLADYPDVVIACFPYKTTRLAQQLFDLEHIDTRVAALEIPIYALNYKGRRIGFFSAPLGGPASASVLEELLVKGAKKVLYFGSCGSLDKSVSGGSLLIPTAAYRGEGTSFYYAPPSDYIDIPSASRLAEVFDSLHIPYTFVKTWTTDAAYRETRAAMDARKAEGCSVVEMECASIMSVAQFRKAEVYQFLYAADCLDGEQWDPRLLGSMPDDMRTRILTVALETALRL